MPKHIFAEGLSEEAKLALAILGKNIRTARKARGWTIESAAERCLVSINGLRGAESGNPGTAIGIYLALLDTMGLANGIQDLAAPHTDTTGQRMQEARKHSAKRASGARLA